MAETRIAMSYEDVAYQLDAIDTAQIALPSTDETAIMVRVGDAHYAIKCVTSFVSIDGILTVILDAN